MERLIITEDNILIERIKGGDSSAYDTLFRRYYAQLCAFACRYAEISDAENAVQDVMLYIWEKRESLIIRNSVSTYLYNAVKNHCLSLMNRGIIKEKVMNSIQKAMRDNYDDTDSCTAEELYRKYEEAIRSLPESMRDAFEKSRFGNMKFKEIANEAGVSVKTVEYRIYGAVKILRAKLKDYLPFFVHILWL